MFFIVDVLAVYEGYIFPTFSPAFVLSGVLNDSHSNRVEVEY
jgi:hypothetical protein